MRSSLLSGECATTTTVGGRGGGGGETNQLL